MPELIKTLMPAKTAEEIAAAIAQQVATIKPFSVNLTDEVKRGSRTMAEGREGYARQVSKIATANIDSLARENDPKELEDKLIYDSQLETIRQILLTGLEMIVETQLANGIDIMKMVDAFVDNLQTSRSRNGALDAAMKDVDEYNKRFGSPGSTTPKATE